jgi:hypothetical protein
MFNPISLKVLNELLLLGTITVIVEVAELVTG